MNVKDINVGDIVLVRIEVTEINLAGNTIEYVDNVHGGYSWLNGSKIEEVRKALFDWETVKPGFCFRNLEGNLRYYIAEDPRPEAGFDLVMYNFEGTILGADRGILTRFPEGDKNVE